MLDGRGTLALDSVQNYAGKRLSCQDTNSPCAIQSFLGCVMEVYGRNSPKIRKARRETFPQQRNRKSQAFRSCGVSSYRSSGSCRIAADAPHSLPSSLASRPWRVIVRTGSDEPLLSFFLTRVSWAAWTELPYSRIENIVLTSTWNRMGAKNRLLGLEY